MEKRIKKILSILLLITIIFFFIYYIYKNISDFRSIRFVNPVYIFIILIIFIVNYFIIGLTTKNLLLPLKVNLSKLEAFALSLATGFYNLITPFRGGLAARAIYLKKKHDFSYSDFFATLSASYVIIFFISSLLGMISTWMIYTETKIFSWIVFLVFLGVFIPLLMIIIFSPRIPETKYSYINYFIKIINGWHLIKNNRKLIAIISLLTMIQTLLSAFSTYLSFFIFGSNITFIKALFITSISFLGILISITPAGLGIGETITVFSALTIGISPSQSLSAAILGRVISTISLLILGPICSYWLLKKKDKK